MLRVKPKMPVPIMIWPCASNEILAKYMYPKKRLIRDIGTDRNAIELKGQDAYTRDLSVTREAQITIFRSS